MHTIDHCFAVKFGFSTLTVWTERSVFITGPEQPNKIVWGSLYNKMCTDYTKHYLDIERPFENSLFSWNWKLFAKSTVGKIKS